MRLPDDSGMTKIERHLLDGYSLTGLDAIKMYGVYRLSSVINRLRARGMKIETVMREDNGKQFGEYRIAKQQEDLFI